MVMDDDGVDDMSGLGDHLGVEPAALKAFQEELREFMAENLLKLDALFARHPQVLEAVSEYGITLQMVPFEVEFEPENADSGLH